MKVKSGSYELVEIDPCRYEFFSEGPKGEIRKVIQYHHTRSSGGHYFNLGFGDYNELTGEINDLIISNNGDAHRVLSTVVNSIIDFMNNHPGETVYARGSTPGRTRLYQIGIAGILEEINISFRILGFRNGEWELFQKGKNYTAFTIKEK